MAGSGLDFVSRIIFPAPRASYGLESYPGELLWLPAQGPQDRPSADDVAESADGHLGLWLPCPSARYVIYYLHSNGEDLGRCRQFLLNLRTQFQVHALAVEYPGYGACPGGQCDERLANGSAHAGLRFLREVVRWPDDSIIVMGRSIGCGPACALASQHDLGGLVLIAPMLSFRELCKDYAPSIAEHVEERFPNGARLQKSTTPLLVVHGAKDTVIPPRHGRALYELSAGRKLLVTPPELGHNCDLFSDVQALIAPMLRFFAMPDYAFVDPVVPSWAFDLRSAEEAAGGAREDAAGACAASLLALAAGALGIGAWSREGAKAGAELAAGLAGLRALARQASPSARARRREASPSPARQQAVSADARRREDGGAGGRRRAASPSAAAPTAPCPPWMPPFVALGHTASRARLQAATRLASLDIVACLAQEDEV